MGDIDGQKHRWMAAVVLTTMLFVGCSPADPSPRIVNVEVLESGRVAFLGSTEFPEYERETSHETIGWTVLTEVCIADSPNDCARITLGSGHLEESNDGGDSWSTVLKIDQNESWVSPLVENSYEDVDVEGFDLAQTPDGQILVAMGRLGVVERNADGDWSTSDSEFRHLDSTPALAVVAAFAVLLVSLSWHRLKSTLVRRDPRRNFATSPAAGRVSILAAAPAIVLTVAAVNFEGGIGLLFAMAVVLGFPLSVLSLLITFLTAVQCFRADTRSSFSTLRGSLATVAVFVVLLLGIELLWSNAFIGWHTAILLAAVTAAGALAIAARTFELDIPHPALVAAEAP